MKLRNIFKSRDKPVKDRTSGSAYTFFMGGSTAGKNGKTYQGFPVLRQL